MFNNNDKLFNDYISVLNNDKKNENDIQNFLEINSELIPTTYHRLGHGVHFSSVISKYPLGNSYVSDLLYLTKSTTRWNIIFIELENQHNKIFCKNLDCTSDFNHALQQIRMWKSYLHDSNNKATLIHNLKNFMSLHEFLNNPVDIKYLLVYGRRNELENNQDRINIFNQLSNETQTVITYDSLISNYQNNYNEKCIILSPKGDVNFKIKILPKNLSSLIFANIRSSMLEVSPDYINQLKSEGYEMDAWLKGELLIVDSKRTKKHLFESMRQKKIDL